jgi:hypothetical protein
MVSPDTEPHDRATLSPVTTPSGRFSGGGDVVVDELVAASGALVSLWEVSDPATGSVVVVLEDAAVMSEDAPGVGDTMLSPPATHAEANAHTTTRREISRGMCGECRKGADLCCGNGAS